MFQLSDIAQMAKRIRVKLNQENKKWSVLNPKADPRHRWQPMHILTELDSLQLEDVAFTVLPGDGCGNGPLGYAEGTISYRDPLPKTADKLGFSACIKSFFNAATGSPLTSVKRLSMEEGGHARILDLQ